MRELLANLIGTAKAYVPEVDVRSMATSIQASMPDPSKAKDLTLEDVKQAMTWDNAYKAYNGAVAALVLWEYFTSPDAAFMEYAADIGVHAFEAMRSNEYHTLGLMLNAGRFGIAFNSFFTGMSTIPMRANLFDMAFHGYNSHHRFNGVTEDIKAAQSKPAVTLSGGPRATSACACGGACASACCAKPTEGSVKTPKITMKEPEPERPKDPSKTRSNKKLL